MALIVEDGTIVPNANSYVSLTFADSYFEDRGNPSVWSDATDEQKEAGILYASSILNNSYAWKGQLVDRDVQLMSWPRYSVVDDDNRLFTYPNSVSHDGKALPDRLLHACCELAFAHLSVSLNQALERGGGVSRIRVGPLEQEYFESADFDRKYPFVDILLSGLHYGKTSGGGAFISELIRG